MSKLEFVSNLRNHLNSTFRGQYMFILSMNGRLEIYDMAYYKIPVEIDVVLTEETITIKLLNCLNSYREIVSYAEII